jgi:hypothetical protein
VDDGHEARAVASSAWLAALSSAAAARRSQDRPWHNQPCLPPSPPDTAADNPAQLVAGLSPEAQRAIALARWGSVSGILDAQADTLLAAAAKGPAPLRDSMLLAGCALAADGTFPAGAIKDYRRGHRVAQPGNSLTEDTIYVWQKVQERGGGFAVGIAGRGPRTRTFFATGGNAQLAADEAARACVEQEHKAMVLGLGRPLFHSLRSVPDNYATLSTLGTYTGSASLYASDIMRQCGRLTFFNAPTRTGQSSWDADARFVAWAPETAVWGIITQREAYKGWLAPRINTARAMAELLATLPHGAALVGDVRDEAADNAQREYGSADMWALPLDHDQDIVTALRRNTERAADMCLACPSFAAPFTVMGPAAPRVGIALGEEGSLELQLEGARAALRARLEPQAELESHLDGADLRKAADSRARLRALRKAVTKIEEEARRLQRRLDVLRAGAPAPRVVPPPAAGRPKRTTAAGAAVGKEGPKRGAKEPRR